MRSSTAQSRPFSNAPTTCHSDGKAARTALATALTLGAMSLGYGVPGTNAPSYRYSCNATNMSYADLIRTIRFVRERR